MCIAAPGATALLPLTETRSKKRYHARPFGFNRSLLSLYTQAVTLSNLSIDESSTSDLGKRSEAGLYVLVYFVGILCQVKLD
jgi:hypothetical protein